MVKEAGCLSRGWLRRVTNSTGGARSAARLFGRNGYGIERGAGKFDVWRRLASTGGMTPMESQGVMTASCGNRRFLRHSRARG